MRCVYGWAGVRYVITKFSRLDSLPNFLPMVLRCARASRARELRYYQRTNVALHTFLALWQIAVARRLRYQLTDELVAQTLLLTPLSSIDAFPDANYKDLKKERAEEMGNGTEKRQSAVS